jgi:hypothetical protein
MNNVGEYTIDRIDEFFVLFGTMGVTRKPDSEVCQCDGHLQVLLQTNRKNL